MTLVTKFENKMSYYKTVRGTLTTVRLNAKIVGYPVLDTM